MKNRYHKGRIISILIGLVLMSSICFASSGINLKDGEYEVTLEMEGGSGRATVESPTTLRVDNGAAILTVIWSSPNYDYMVVDGQTYYPVNTEGNSEFEIPVATIGESFPVIGDTVAMSKPHEVQYAFTVTLADNSNKKTIATIASVIILAVIVIIQGTKSKRIIDGARANEEEDN